MTTRCVTAQVPAAAHIRDSQPSCSPRWDCCRSFTSLHDDCCNQAIALIDRAFMPVSVSCGVAVD